LTIKFTQRTLTGFQLSAFSSQPEYLPLDPHRELPTHHLEPNVSLRPQTLLASPPGSSRALWRTPAGF